jgi:hypothetical protein
MSKNFELLYRAGQEVGAIRAELPVNVSVLLDDKRTLTPEWKPSSSTHPEILKLVQALFLSSATAPHHVVFCGVGDSEAGGKVCESVARALANEVSGRVCLVDAKVPAPAQSIESNGCTAQPRQIEQNLWFAAASNLSSDGLSNGGVEQLCSHVLELRKEFDYLLIDAPPLGADILASVVGQVTDGVVLVLEANATRRVTALDAKQTLDAAKVRLLGTVLNNRTFPIPEKLYRRL